MSSNQKTSIKLSVPGGESKIIPNVSINYLHPSLESFQKHVMTLIRLHPAEPLYECESIVIKTDEGDRTIDAAVLKEVLAGLSKKAIAGSGCRSDKLKLIVKARSPFGTAVAADQSLVVSKQTTKTVSGGSSKLSKRPPADNKENTGNRLHITATDEICLLSSDEAVMPSPSVVSSLGAADDDVDAAAGGGVDNIPCDASCGSIELQKEVIVDRLFYSPNPKKSAKAVGFTSPQGARALSAATTVSSAQKKATPVFRRKPTTQQQQQIEEQEDERPEDEYMYKGGLTAGEASRVFASSLRSDASAPVATRSELLSPSAKGAAPAGGSSKKSGGGATGMKKTVLFSPQKAGGGRGGGGGVGNKGGGAGAGLALGASSGSKKSGLGFDACDGRPSIGTMTRQWEFMKNNFLNNSADELDWLMVSKSAGAYNYAHRKQETAEDKYFKSMCDITMLESVLPELTATSRLANTLQLISNELEALQSVCDNNSEASQRVEDGKNKLSTLLEDTVFDVLRPAFKKTLSGITTAVRPGTVAKYSRSVLTQDLSVEEKATKKLLADARSAQDVALAEMECWSKREVETVDYQEVLQKEEEVWLLREHDANLAALETMRGFIPANVSTLSVKDIIDTVRERGGLISTELATEIKTNKLLHWIVTHTEDISTAFFLAGESKQYFENIEGLDIVELRALTACLPVRFELDADGRKAQWRTRFMSRVKVLVSQQHRETVKGAWDFTAKKRSLVTLPPLRQEQERRSVYFHRTKTQCLLKMKQYNDKEALLKRKQGWLAKAQEECVELKKEYDTILSELRDPEIKKLLTAEQVTSAKSDAKLQWSNAEANKKSLLQEVSRLKTTIADAPISKDEFVRNMGELEEFFRIRDVDWNNDVTTPIPIEGVFDHHPDIQRIQRASAKFLSAEEEADIRRLEILALSSSSCKNKNKGLSTTTAETTNCDSQLQLQQQLSGTVDHSDDQSLLISDHLDRNHTSSTSEDGVSVSDTATALADVTNNEHTSIAAAFRESQGEEYPLVVTDDGTTATATPATPAGPAPRYTTNNTTTSAVTATMTTPTAQPTATAISTPPPVGILNIVEAVAPTVSTSTIFSPPTAAAVATTSTTATTPPARPRSVHHRMNSELLSTLNRMFSPGPRGTGTGNTTPGPAGPTTNKAAGLFVPTNPTAAAANPHPDKAEEGSSQRQTTSSTAAAAAGTRSNVVVTEEEGEANTPTSNLGDGGGCKQKDEQVDRLLVTVPTSTATTTATSILPSSNKIIAAAVAPKSKLLQKFLGRPADSSAGDNGLSASLPLPPTMPVCCAGTAPSLAPAPVHNKPMLSFLDQIIKAAKKGPASNPEDIVANLSSSLPAPHNKPMLSFLDQIKAAKKGPASNSSDIAVVATTSTECAVVAGGGNDDAAGSSGGPLPRRELPPPRPAGGGGGAMAGLGLGFLDAIKARRLS